MDWRHWRDRLALLTTSRGLVLTGPRIRAAYGVAIATDVLQFVLGPFGWAGSDQVLDIIAMIATTKLLGFHPLLLPTFVIEMFPIADVLPTWMGCVALVVALRKRQGPTSFSTDDKAVTIDIKPTHVA